MCRWKLEDVCEHHTVRSMLHCFWASTAVVWRSEAINECDVPLTVITSQEITHTFPLCHAPDLSTFPRGGERKTLLKLSDVYWGTWVKEHHRDWCSQHLHGPPHCHPLIFLILFACQSETPPPLPSQISFFKSTPVMRNCRVCHEAF